MTGSPLEPGPFGDALIEAVPELGELADLEVRIPCNLDSSDIGPEQWRVLAEMIESEWASWDGFVIVHGTDTMAFTASALAFALNGMDRPVILTGAQRPLRALRTDARRNLADAVELATKGVCEVGICFDGLLLRGCSSVKADSSRYRAFSSPGVEPLAILGTDVEFGGHVRPPGAGLRCRAAFEPGVEVVYLAPGIHPGGLEQRLSQPQLRGVVLAAFGAGTAPHKGVAEAVCRAVERGIDVLAVTQRGGHTDLSLYANSRALERAGVISGGAMRIEAAVPKLMHALAWYPDRDERRRYLLRNVAGERA